MNDNTKTYPDLPDWVFRIDEVSAGVYEVIGKDRAGHALAANSCD